MDEKLVLTFKGYTIIKSEIKIVEGKKNKINLFSSIVYSIKLLLSFDYLVADYLKYRIQKKFKNNQLVSRYKKGSLVLYFNWLNVSFIMLMAAVVIMSDFSSRWSICLISFIIYRTFSRSLEIIFAFYGDVATKRGNPKSTDLKYYNRLSLAVFSYLEIVLSYALIYNSLGDENFIESIYRSLEVMTFTSLGIYQKIVSISDVISLVQIGQAFVSLTLVIFAIASYVGSAGENKNC